MRGLETDGSRSRSPGDGPLWLPGMVLSLILGNAFGQVQAVLPPQNVTLTSENFFLFLTWQPLLDFTNNTQYEVQRRSRDSSSSPDWTNVTSCLENKTRQTQRCDLLPSSPYDFYQARVRARDGVRVSKWASSNLLQPYKDTIIGPLGLSLTATNDNLKVVISLPPTPWADDDSSALSVDIRNFRYQMTLIKEGAELYNTTVQFKGNKFTHAYANLEHSANYCVKAKAMNQPTKESIQCIRMPGRPAGTAGFVMASVIGLILSGMILSISARTIFRHHTQWNPSKTFFPKSLTFLNPELNGNPPTLSPAPHLEEDCIASVSAEVLPCKTNTALQLSPRGCSAQVRSTYCAGGFDASSWSSDFLSSGELDYPTGEDYRPAPEFTGPSAHLSPSSARLLPHDAGTRCIIQNWECEIDHKSRLIGSSPSSRADIPFNSVKLQTMVDILYSPETYLVRADRDTPQGTPAQETIASEVHHESHGFPKASDFLDDSSLELRDTKTMPFSGYEFRQPILFCE